MDDNRIKYMGRVLIRRFCSFRAGEDVSSILSELKDTPPEIRVSTARGVIAVAVDENEKVADRVRALTVFQGIAALCGFVDDEEIGQKLKEVVDNGEDASASDVGQTNPSAARDLADLRWLQIAALLTLMTVNKSVAWETLNKMIAIHKAADFGQELQKIKDRFLKRG